MRSSLGGLTLSRLGDPLCIDFVNRTNPRLEPPQKRFVASYEALIAWADEAGVLSRSERKHLVEAGERDPRRARLILRRAVALREGLFAVFSARPGSRAGMETLNTEIRLTTAELEIAREGRTFVVDWNASSKILGPIVLSAIQLLTSSDLQWVRVCAGSRRGGGSDGSGGCEGLFLDTSRAHRRRWCSMAVCGNRAKARRHRIRSRALRGNFV